MNSDVLHFSQNNYHLLTQNYLIGLCNGDNVFTVKQQLKILIIFGLTLDLIEADETGSMTVVDAVSSW